MNPLTNVKNITKLNETELKLGINEKTSWHKKYKDSAWIFVGGLDYELTEGDIICVFSQFGEIVNINLIRDKKTGKSKGYCFLCFEDQRSTVLSVDNLNGISSRKRSDTGLCPPALPPAGALGAPFPPRWKGCLLSGARRRGVCAGAPRRPTAAATPAWTGVAPTRRRSGLPGRAPVGPAPRGGRSCGPLGP